MATKQESPERAAKALNLWAISPPAPFFIVISSLSPSLSSFFLVFLIEFFHYVAIGPDFLHPAS